MTAAPMTVYVGSTKKPKPVKKPGKPKGGKK